MTELLKKAFQEASKLPPKEQDAFAALVLAEIEAEGRWFQAISESPCSEEPGRRSAR